MTDKKPFQKKQRLILLVAFSFPICNTGMKIGITLLQQTYYHSPFSEKSAFKREEKALLLSFALSELFTCATTPIVSWENRSYQRSQDAPLNKFQEHLILLRIAFSEFDMKETQEKLYALTYAVKKSHISSLEKLKDLFSLMRPLIYECKENENLLFFLLSHQKEIEILTDPLYLPSFFKGSKELQVKLCDFFHKKGFTALLPTITSFFTEIHKVEA